MSRPLKVIQIGNFGPPHSTENHLAVALKANGHNVIKLQENEFDTFGRMSDIETWPTRPDFILWTRTGWDWNSVFGERGEFIAHALQRGMLMTASAAGIPVVGYHLDIWFGLNREHQLAEPFFQSDLVITADGGHPAEFVERNINHVWFPPGVSRDECQLGTARDEFRSKLAFVGSWAGHYHQEHQHRFELVAWLKKNFRRDCEFYPKVGQHAVRGQDLRDLYASVDVVVGDSCFAGSGLANYWSDRIPETLGRGGYLLHPWVEGLSDHYPVPMGPVTWEVGDWDHLGSLVESSLALPASERGAISRLNHQWVIEYDTYECRIEQLVELLNERNYL